jgi:hypothetical protein
MRLLIILALLATNVYALTDVTCYSKSTGRLLYNKKHLHDVYIGDGFVAINHTTHAEIIMGDCVIDYKSK